MQPAPRSMGNFPTFHGKIASFFLDVGVQQEYAFIPDDGSTTFVVNVEVSFFSFCVLYENFSLDKYYQVAYWSWFPLAT